LSAIKLYNKEKNTVATIQTENNDISQTYTLIEGSNLKLVGTITSDIRLRVGPKSKFKNLKDAIFHALEYNRTSSKIYIDIDSNYVWEELELKGVNLNNIEIVPPSNFLDVKNNARFCINLYSVRNFTCNNLKLDLKQRTKTTNHPYFMFRDGTVSNLDGLNVKGVVDLTVGANSDIQFIRNIKNSYLTCHNMNLNFTYNITDTDDYTSSQNFITTYENSGIETSRSVITVTNNRSGTEIYRRTRFISVGTMSVIDFSTTTFTFTSNREEYCAICAGANSKVILLSCAINLQNYPNNGAILAEANGRIDFSRTNTMNLKDASVIPFSVQYSGSISEIRSITFNPVPTKYGNIDLNTQTPNGIITT
jgi:hypothetical protein